MLILPLLAHEATLAQALLRRHSIEASGCVIYMRDVVDDIHDFIAFCETLSTTPAVSSTCTIIDDIVAFTAGQPHRKKGSITAFKHCSRMRFKKLKKKKRKVTPANAARIREHNLNATKATDIIDFDGESSKRRSAYTEIPHPTCAVPSHPSPTPAPPPTIDFVAWFTPPSQARVWQVPGLAPTSAAPHQLRLDPVQEAGALAVHECSKSCAIVDQGGRCNVWNPPLPRNELSLCHGPPGRIPAAEVFEFGLQ